jgi:uncharacterized protein YukE
MGVKIIVDTEKLNPADEQIIEKADDYKALVNKLFNRIEYMSVVWQGSDNLAYINQINGLKAQYDQIDTVIRQYANMLKSADKEYEQTLRSSYAAANSI